MRIIGIDPGFAITGYGIVDYIGNRFRVIEYGAITTPSGQQLPDRLLQISRELERILTIHTPDSMAVEQLFFSKNTKTALSVAHGRGVVVVEGAKRNIAVFEYTPLQVKQALCGYGRADKHQIQQMVKIFLNLQQVPKPDDVADALAIAICHAHSYSLASIR